MKEYRLGPWPVGLDNVSDPYAASQGALRGAKNVEIDKDGTVSVRPGLFKVAADEISSLHYSEPLEKNLCQNGSQIAQVDGATVTNLFDTGSTQDFGWDDHEDRTYCATPNGIVVLDPDPRWVHVSEISGPLLTVNTNGGLYAGRYGVAVAAVENGVEGPLSAIKFIELEYGEGIDVALQPGFSLYRVYRTEANGTTLYHAADVTGDTTLGVSTLGRVADTQHTRQMVGGRIVRFWKGRLWVARGKALHWSSPLREGVTDLRHNFVQFRTRVVMVEPVEEGIFVGTMRRVYFFAGRDPREWVQTPVDSDVIPYASQRLDGSMMDPELGISPLPCAIWLSTKGYVIGTPSGSIVQPQRLRLTIPKTASGSVAIHGRRVLALVS